MRIMIPCTLLLLSARGLPAQAPSPVDRAAIRREVESRTLAMSEAYRRGDMRGVARFYADDARLYSTGTMIEGRAEIDLFWRKVRNPLTWTMETVDVGGSRDEPYQLVRSILIHGDRVHADTSFTMCLLVWRRDANGQLRIRLDVYADYSRDDFNLSSSGRPVPDAAWVKARTIGWSRPSRARRSG